MPHQLHPLETVLVHLQSIKSRILRRGHARVDNVRATALQIVIQVRDLCPVSVIISLVDDLVASFHGAKLANAQILFKPLQALQVLL